MNRTRVVYVFSFLIAVGKLAVSANASEDPPEIVAVRKVYAEVEKLIEGKELKIRSTPDDDIDRNAWATLYFDDKGTVRKYQCSAAHGGGTGTSYATYYDAAGRQRFGLFTADSDSQKLETRAYFNEKGTLIKEFSRCYEDDQEGPCPSKTLPYNQPFKDPIKHFDQVTKEGSLYYPNSPSGVKN